MIAFKLRSLSRLSSKVLRCEIVNLHTSTSLLNLNSTPSLAELSKIPVQYGVERQVWVENMDTRYLETHPKMGL